MKGKVQYENEGGRGPHKGKSTKKKKEGRVAADESQEPRDHVEPNEGEQEKTEAHSESLLKVLYFKNIVRTRPD